jgi:3-hydroxyacyl-CoA dehydrogenase
VLNRIEKVAISGAGALGGGIAVGIALARRTIPGSDPLQS